MTSSEAQPARKPQRRTRGKPTSVDAHVGRRVWLRRTLLGLSQEKLGEALDLTFQQIQKYENGANRISAGRLYQLSQALQVPVSYFFEGLRGTKAEEPDVTDELLRFQANLGLLRDYSRIPDPALQDGIRHLIRVMAGDRQTGEPHDEPLERISK